MAEKFHISSSGEAAACTASIKECPRGGAESHYPDAESAQKAYELSNAYREAPPSLSKKSASTEKPAEAAPKKDAPSTKEEKAASITGSEIDPQKALPEINGVRPVDDQLHIRAILNNKDTQILKTADGTTVAYSPKHDTYTTVEQWRSERFGKTVTVFGGVTAYAQSAGKSKGTGATPEKLRKGRGDYAPTVDRVKSVEDLYPMVRGVGNSWGEGTAQTFPRRTKEEKQAIKDAGYPETTGLTPAPMVSEENKREPEHGEFFRPNAVLPTGDRVNPHAAPENNQYIDSWNAMGSKFERQNHIIVVETESGSHRLIGTAGKADSARADQIGDTFGMMHDQTHRDMGRAKVVGRFEPWPGGRAEGVIPNKSMSLATYK